MTPKQADFRSSDAFLAHPDLRAGFGALAPATDRAAGSILFRQGEESCGVFLLLEGKARLLLSTPQASQMPFRVVGPGYLLGLPSAIVGSPFIYSAELLEDAKVVFVPRDTLLQFLRTRSDLCFEVVTLLGMEVREMPGAAARHADRRRRRRR